jgi:hypothetical protein
MPVVAGYLLSDGNKIWGIGATLDQAQYDARREGEYLDHDGEEMDDWIYGLRVLPATAALVAAARDNRWIRARKLTGRFWENGVWGTQAEYDAINK